MDFQNTWIKYGIYYGLVSVIVLLFSFYITPLGLGLQMLLGLATMITLFVLAGREQKNKNMGVLSYGEALKTTFLCGFVGAVISGLFMMILTNFFDPSLIDILKEQGIEAAKSMMEMFGAPEDTISEALEKAETDMEGKFSPINQILSIFQSALFVLIIAAIVSIFLKKDEAIA